MESVAFRAPMTRSGWSSPTFHHTWTTASTIVRQHNAVLSSMVQRGQQAHNSLGAHKAPTGDRMERGSRQRGRGQEGHRVEAGVRSVYWEMGCTAPRCPMSCHDQGKEAAAKGCALGTLHPIHYAPLAAELCWSETVPRDTWGLQLPRSPPWSTWDCSRQRSPSVTRLCCVTHSLSPPGCHPAWL